MVHEFAHAVHGVEPFQGFDARLKSAYENAIDTGLWEGSYAATNRAEYWAVATQAWFELGGHEIDTRWELEIYDPAIFGLIREVFGDGQILPLPPSTRIQGTVVREDGKSLPPGFRVFCLAVFPT